MDNSYNNHNYVPVFVVTLVDRKAPLGNFNGCHVLQVSVGFNVDLKVEDIQLEIDKITTSTWSRPDLSVY